MGVLVWCCGARPVPHKEKKLMNIRTVVHAHLTRERLDVLIAVLAPLVLMLESGYACGWVFANGDLTLTNPNTYLALGRGIFLEGLIFAMFKLVRVFALKGGRVLLLAPLPFMIGVVGMIVSAGCNLGWVNRSGEMTSVVSMVGQFMPPLLVTTFKVGLGLLFPLAVGAFALFDVTHLVEEILKSSHLDNRAVKVHRAEMHRTHYLAAQKKAGAKVRKEYDEICETDAQNMASRVRQGDLSFGAEEIEPARSSVTRLSAPTSVRQLPPLQNTLTGQFGPAPMASSGNTQQIVMPPPPVQPQGQSWLSRIANFGGQ
jgi:hypothetical protein